MKNCFLILLVLVAVSSCKREIENYHSDSVSDYLPLQVGNYIVYRLDSTVFTNFNQNMEIHSYEEKDVVDAQITDAEGRPSYRIYRFIRDTTGLQSWKSGGTYFVTPLQKQIEVVDNNLRYIKLHAPITTGFSWKGNSYLNSEPYKDLYDFSNDNSMFAWNYHYTTLTDVFNYKQQILKNVLTVAQVDEKNKLDTVNVAGNAAVIPLNADAVWIRGTASDTVRISASAPGSSHEEMVVYNRTNVYATFSSILIPPGNSLRFRYFNNKWGYPNPLVVASNKVSLGYNHSIAYILGTATDSIRVSVRDLDTSRVKAVSIYNRSNNDAYCYFNDALSKLKIAPGFGRSFELYQGEWKFKELLDKDPYSTESPFGNISYSVEKYAKGIGLVHQELLLWEYQPNPGGISGYKIGFGVKRTMIDHN